MRPRQAPPAAGAKPSRPQKIRSVQVRSSAVQRIAGERVAELRKAFAVGHGASSSRATPPEQRPEPRHVSTRKRRAGELCELVDTGKHSLASRRMAAAQRAQKWSVGDAVEARFCAKKGGTGWFRGRISRVHNLDDDEPNGPGCAYDIEYDDGDVEHAVLARHVRGAPVAELRE